MRRRARNGNLQGGIALPDSVADCEGFQRYASRQIDARSGSPHVDYRLAAFLRCAHLFFMAALIRALPSALITCLPPRVPVLPASSLRACCSRVISASIVAINSDVFKSSSCCENNPR